MTSPTTPEQPQARKSCSAVTQTVAGAPACSNGHAMTPPCLGICADTIAPVCTQESRQFDERTGTVRLHHWMGQ